MWSSELFFSLMVFFFSFFSSFSSTFLSPRLILNLLTFCCNYKLQTHQNGCPPLVLFIPLRDSVFIDGLLHGVGAKRSHRLLWYQDSGNKEVFRDNMNYKFINLFLWRSDDRVRLCEYNRAIHNKYIQKQVARPCLCYDTCDNYRISHFEIRSFMCKLEKFSALHMLCS